MSHHTEILTQVNRRTGMTVPEGYFEQFASRMESRLAELPATEAPRPVKGGLWYTVRPYVYMAAMFAGIWCMMHIFNFMGSNNVDLSIESHPVVATALSNDEFVEEYIIPDAGGYDLMEQLYESWAMPEDNQASSDTISDEYINDDIDYSDVDAPTSSSNTTPQE